MFSYSTQDVIRDRTTPSGACEGMGGLNDISVAGVRDKVLTILPGCNQCTVNEYEPGQGIGGHVDTESAFGEEIVSVSTGSGVVMEFREIGGKGRRKDVWLERGR